MQNQDQFVRCRHVMKTLGVSKATVYRIIASLNEELVAQCIRTTPGRVSRAHP